MTATPLSGHLEKLIAAEGPLTVARYMEICLLHPEQGYYTGREPFGHAGDFITAPEISQVFGELIGLWCGAVWQQIGAPERIALAELGPGRGTLMADALRAMKIVPGLTDAAEIHLLEASPRLREVQRAALRDAQISWHDTPESLPECQTLFIGNEFFDALPIRQLLFKGGAWHERMVSWDQHRAGPVWTTAPATGDLVGRIPPQAGTPQEDDIIEIAEPSRKAMGQIARHLARNGGAGLFIDYGHARSGYGDTFQAVRNHKPEHVFAMPGSADLTAHVDFQALLREATMAGCTPFGPVTQAAFLTALGIEARLARLTQAAGPEQGATLRSGARRLIDPAEMGTLFKAVAVAAPGIIELPGFGLPTDLARS